MSIADRLAQKDLTLSTGPKEPPSAPSNGAEHAQLVKDLEDANYAQFQRFLAELKAEIGRDAAQLSGQLKEWEAGFERNQTAWSEEAKSLAQKSLNAALRAARENSVRLLEDSSRENAALITPEKISINKKSVGQLTSEPGSAWRRCGSTKCN